MYKIGAAKADITAFKLGVGMLGYGMYYNIVKGVETDLYARAYVLEDDKSGRKVVFVNAEMAFITIAIKRGVMKRLERKYPELGFAEDNVFLSAQHTHSAPGGYSYYGLYNMSTPGFVPEVYQYIVDGIVDAIVRADKNKQAGSIRIGRSSFAIDKEVAFNRSIKAYNRNPEVKTAIAEEESYAAVDRNMIMLHFEAENGAPIGSVNWFGVHTTSISNDNHRICSDNKGYAARYLEESMMKKGHPEFQAAFAQGSAGDITPNWIVDRKKKWTRGKFEDDFESAKFNGRIQYDAAREATDNAAKQEEIPAFIDYGLAFVDFRNVIIDPEFAWDDKDARTGPACHGVAFFSGTKEGPGMDPVVATLATTLARGIKTAELAKAKLSKPQIAKPILDKYRIQGKKDILVEAGECKILGTKDIKNLVIPNWADPAVHAFKKFHANGSLGNKPWTPQTLPLQIAVIGNIALVGVPGEITTIAGKRLQKTVADVLRPRGVDYVLITSYCNAYCGYITTYQEYQSQCYEGGHTVFGEHTLGAFQTKYKQLAIEMTKPFNNRKQLKIDQPTSFSEEELSKRSFNIRTQKRLIQIDD
jgi:neutral ceramidase